ncbi:hypothetical protein Ga0074812_13915 [Parafrankia irregularis]|uniref:Uncharacterized protein n=1 Tax=Parafrankia irregularis TaxID=795642 RepID=A0A0S4QZ41_9ACTN|nr:MULTISPECIES: hypothetical protein [Parafrankia]MBE3206417.1 hypothetical protein [Parafrankia sp. CH37]CUU60382.1 hypothetical protein Ga0074812_13915 [Parafrankia irregularis]
MSTTSTPDIETVETLLRKARRHGARGPELAQHLPALIDLLVPPNGTSPKERAAHAEQIIRKAIDTALDDPAKSAMRVLFGLAAGTRRSSVDFRRERAAAYMGITPGAFRRPRQEGVMILNIAFEIAATA